MIWETVTDGQITDGLHDVSNYLGYYLLIYMKKLDLLEKVQYHLGVTRTSVRSDYLHKG